MTYSTFKLSANQFCIITEAVQKRPNWSASENCKTLNALAKKGLMVYKSHGMWEITELAKQKF